MESIDYSLATDKSESGEEYILNIPDIYEYSPTKDQMELANKHSNYFARKIKKDIATGQLHHLSKERAIKVISDYIKSKLFRDLAIRMIHAQFVEAYPNNALDLTNDYLEPNSIPDNSEYLLDALFMFNEKWKESCQSKLYDIYKRLMECGLHHFNMSRQKNISNYFEAGMFGISLKVPNCSEYYEGKCYKVNIAPNLFDINFCNDNNIGSNKVVRGISVSYPFARLYIPLPGGNCIVSEDLGDGTYKIIYVSSSTYEATLKHYVDVIFSTGGEFYQIGGRRFNNKSDAVSYINGIWKEASQKQSSFFASYYDQVLTEEQVDAIKEEYLHSGLNEKLCNSITSASTYPYRDLKLTFPNVNDPTSEVSIHLNHTKNSTRYKFEITGSPNNLCDEDQSIYGEHISLFEEKFGKELTECEVDEIILKYITSDLFKKYVKSFIKGMYEFRNAHTSPDDQIEYNEQDIERLLSTFVAMTSTWNNVFAESKSNNFYHRFKRVDGEKS